MRCLNKFFAISTWVIAILAGLCLVGLLSRGFYGYVANYGSLSPSVKAQYTSGSIFSDIFTYRARNDLPVLGRALVPIDELLPLIKRKGVKAAYYDLEAFSEGFIDLNHPCVLILKLEDNRLYHLFYCDCNGGLTNSSSPVDKPIDHEKYRPMWKPE